MKFLLAILGLQAFAFDQGNLKMSKEDVGKIQASYKLQFGKNLELKGLSFDEQAETTLTEDQLSVINTAFADASAEALLNTVVETTSETVGEATSEATGEAVNTDGPTLEELQADLETERTAHRTDQDTIDNLNAQITAMGEGTESIDLTIMEGQTDFAIPTTGFNAPSPQRFWNQAAIAIAQGNPAQAHALVAASTVDVSFIQTELGDYYRQRHPEIVDFMIHTGDELDTIFKPYGTGLKDELVVVDLFTGDFLQAYNPEWTEKGNFEFQSELVKLHDYKVDHRFKAIELREFITSWLATLTNGTDPFQEPLVAFLHSKMAAKIREEKKIALIQGVYLKSPDGVAGPVMQSIQGVLKSLQTIREEFRIKPFNLGYWDEDVTSDQHIYKLIANGTRMMPRKLRDNSPKIQVLTSKDGREAYLSYIDALKKNTDLNQANVLKVPENIEVVGVPNWNSKVLVWVLPDNIRQFYRQKNEDNSFHTDKEKRDTIIFMDGAAAISPIKSGYEYDSAVEQSYENQIVFLSEEFDDYTYIEALADDKTPSVKVHNSIKLGDNVAATAITAIDDAIDGQMIYLYGDATTNMSTIAAGATFLLEANWVADRGNKLVLKKVGAKFIELGRFGNTDDPDVIQFVADDVTPDLTGGSNFITADDNTAAKAITNFDGAEADKVYRINGGGGTNDTTIATTTSIILTGATWTATVGTWIEFYYTQSGLFKEVGRSV